MSATVVLAFAMQLQAGANRWTEGGPPRAQCAPGFSHCSEVWSMAIDPFDANVLYAAMSTGSYDALDPHGLWRTADGGATWTRLSLRLRGPTDVPVSVHVSPSDPSAIFVLTRYSFYRSSDGGYSWSESAPPADYASNTDLIVSPRNHNTLYAAKENACGFGNCVAGGVHRSDDRGGHWRTIGLAKKRVTRIAADPSDGSTLYAIVDERLLQTRNGGGSWTDMTPPGVTEVSMVTADPQIASTVYVAAPDGIFKSTDRARTWRRLDDGRRVLAVDSLHPLQLVAASGPGLGYGNVARSVDGGESWNVLQDAAMTIYPNELLVGSTGADFHAITANGFIYHYSLVHPRRRAAGK